MDRTHVRAAWRALAIGLALAMPGVALAQGTPVFQSGTASPNHLSKFWNNGLIGDVGGIYGDANGKGVAPFAVQDNLGLGTCWNSAATSGQYSATCIGHDSSGNGLITQDSYGGYPEKNLTARINGVTYNFPVTVGGITGPNSTTLNTIPYWNNTAGSLLGASNGFPYSSLGIAPETYGAVGDCVTDDTEALQDAINAAEAQPKGAVILGPGKCYKFTPPLLVNVDGTTIQGSGWFSTQLKAVSGSGANLINVGYTDVAAAQVQGVVIRDLALVADAPSSGYAISARHTANFQATNIYLGNTACGIEVEQANSTYLTNIWGYTVGSSCEALLFHVTPAVQAAGGRSDQLYIKSFGVNAGYYGNDGFVWRGMANTVNAYDLVILQAKRGLFIDASQNTVGQFPAFGAFYNLQIEGGQLAGCEIDGGRYFAFSDGWCTNAYGGTGPGGSQGTNDTAALLINPDFTASITSDLHFSNMTIGVSGGYAALMHAQGVYFSNTSFRGASLKTALASPSVQINGAAGHGSANYGFSNVKFCGIFGDTVQNNYGLVIGDPVGVVKISNGDFTYCQTGEISSTDSLYQLQVTNSSDRNGFPMLTSAGSYVDLRTASASACGTGPTVEGNDMIGNVITPADAGMTCHIDFANEIHSPSGGGPTNIIVTSNNPAIPVSAVNVTATGFDIASSAALTTVIVFWRVSQGTN